MGSPPRMRGKATLSCFWQLLRGITPAYAGKRLSPTAPGWGRKDHPRVCGEKACTDRPRIGDIGSPPRVRGKAKNCGSSCTINGITPACAGKSAAPRGQCKRQRDHPRVCGEKYEPETGPWRCLGSPPRVRGKEHCPESKFRPGRITPACAGKSRYAAEVCTHVWDHPRVCGEKCISGI